MKFIITGSAGFIGYHMAEHLLSLEHEVVGIDNLNSYYDLRLKKQRINLLQRFGNYQNVELDICDYQKMQEIFRDFSPEIVIHFAAQAGVRYSIDHPFEYLNSNITGFTSVLECCKLIEVKHFIYASSSSVYGSNEVLPFSTDAIVSKPLNLYSASKISNELIAHAYNNLYNLKTTGLRFFTVYGPWGRPDMAYFSFTDSISKGLPIRVFNGGAHSRDFTYIDDLVQAIDRILFAKQNNNFDYNSIKSKESDCRIYNIGSQKSVSLISLINGIENALGKKAILEFVEKQPGDMENTYADMEGFVDEFGFIPSTEIESGIDNFVKWYLKTEGIYF